MISPPPSTTDRVDLNPDATESTTLHRVKSFTLSCTKASPDAMGDLVSDCVRQAVRTYGARRTDAFGSCVVCLLPLMLRRKEYSISIFDPRTTRISLPLIVESHRSSYAYFMMASAAACGWPWWPLVVDAASLTSAPVAGGVWTGINDSSDPGEDATASLVNVPPGKS